MTMPYKYKRVCHICQIPNVICMSSHLEVVHQLSATVRSPYLKCTILRPSAPITRPSLATLEHKIYPKQTQRNVKQHKVYGRNANRSLLSKAYIDSKSLYSLNQKFQACSHRLWLYSPVCFRLGWKSQRQFFSWCHSYAILVGNTNMLHPPPPPPPLQLNRYFH